MQWALFVYLLSQAGGLASPAKHPYRIDYRFQQMEENGAQTSQGTLWVMGNLWKDVQTYPDGVVQVSLYDGHQWWLFVSTAPEPTPTDQPAPTSVLEFFLGREVSLSSPDQNEIVVPRAHGKLIVRGIQNIAGLGPVPQSITFTDAAGKPRWILTIQSIREAPEIDATFFQKSTLTPSRTMELKARDKSKSPVWDY